MDAGGDEGERGASAIDVGDGVNVRTRVKQQLRDLNDVLWSLLPVAFDAVGGDVVK